MKPSWSFLVVVGLLSALVSACAGQPAEVIEGVPQGEPTETVVEAEEAVSSGSSQNAVLPADAPGPCAPSAQEATYESVAGGYCVLYPAGFTVNEPEDGIVVIHGPNYSEGPEPLTGFVNIDASGLADGRTAPQISDELVAPFKGTDIVIERTDAFLGVEKAVEIIGMPGQALSWQVVAVHNGRVYGLTFAPLGEDYAEAFTDMQTLYYIVMRSFAFVD